MHRLNSLDQKSYKNRQIDPMSSLLVSDKYSDSRSMAIPRLHNRIGKVCALVAAAAISPLLAHAQNTLTVPPHPVPPVPVPPHMPEANVVWVLIPFFGAVLLFSTRQFFRPKAPQK
jgi:hypothetical protein